MPAIRIIADDLTGALDSAVRFCGDAGPLPVAWRLDAGTGSGHLALSTETRALDEGAAAARVGEAARMLFDAGHLCFKKIDSLLRGHVVAELAAIVQTGRFDAVVLAPAYPALGRITRAGRQYVRAAGTDRIEQTGPDLTTAFTRAGLACFSAAESVRRSQQPAIWLADVETERDLAQVVADARGWNKRILWCGAGGLAGALAQEPDPEMHPQTGALLIVCGTRHAVATSQIAELAELDCDGVIACRPGFEIDAARALNRRIETGRWAALTPDLPSLTETQAAASIHAMLARLLPAIERPDALFVTGGETLHACCDALGARRLVVHGSHEAGIPVSTLEGGEWDRMTVYSKSGAFGDANTIAEIVRRSAATSHRGGHFSRKNEVRRP